MSESAQEAREPPAPAVKRLPRPKARKVCKDEPDEKAEERGQASSSLGPQPKKMPRGPECKAEPAAEKEPPVDVKSETSVSDISGDEGPSPVTLNARTLAQEQAFSGESIPSWSNGMTKQGQGRGRAGTPAAPKKLEVQKGHLKQKGTPAPPKKLEVQKGHLKQKGRYDSFQTAYGQLTAALRKKAMNEKAEKADNYRRPRPRGGKNRRQWRHWGEKDRPADKSWKPAEPAEPSRAVFDGSPEAQKLKQLSDLLEMVAGQDTGFNRRGGWGEEKELATIRFNTDTVSKTFSDGSSIWLLSNDRQRQRDAGLQWCYRKDAPWILDKMEPLVVVQTSSANVVVKGRRRLKAALALKQNLRAPLYVRCQCYDLEAGATEVPATVLALYALNPAAHMDALAV